MSWSRYNPVRALLLAVGALVARFGIIDRERVERATDLAWPRIITGLARMSRSTADVAMVGIALGPTAIAGVGYASPFWGLAFALGGGVAGGTIGLVSQRFGADAYDELALSVKASAVLTVAITLPLVAVYWFLSAPLIGLIGSGDQAVAFGADYLRVVAFGVPFAALNLIGSRTLVGADDAWTPMILRGGGAVINIILNAVLIFGLGWGVAGAAIGTALSNVLVTAAFGVGLARGGLPCIGEFPVRIPLSGPHFDRSLLGDLVEMATPLIGTNLARSGGQFPKLFIVGLFGPNVVAAYVVAMRVRALMDTPNWGFSMASSSLVGQALGQDDEDDAGVWAHDIIRFSIAVYALIAVGVFVFARPIGRVFVDQPEILPTVVTFIRVACVGVMFSGVYGGSTGPLRASGDTRWPLYAQLAGLYMFALPIAYLGVAVPEFGQTALYVAVFAEMAIPACITYYRYRSGTWKVVSRDYRPDASPTD
ncbi:MATE family efflux transporter [Halosimplex salinum]|uniref:MATE family efflux transporter n=1 Tax=Halosimplex salinum TaxID=1710538 RepID=UPI000F486D46|nr:MATE family efflux transporter [Halosimplex salinum]